MRRVQVVDDAPSSPSRRPRSKAELDAEWESFELRAGGSAGRRPAGRGGGHGRQQQSQDHDGGWGAASFDGAHARASSGGRGRGRRGQQHHDEQRFEQPQLIQPHHSHQQHQQHHQNQHSNNPRRSHGHHGHHARHGHQGQHAAVGFDYSTATPPRPFQHPATDRTVTQHGRAGSAPRKVAITYSTETHAASVHSLQSVPSSGSLGNTGGTGASSPRSAGNSPPQPQKQKQQQPRKQKQQQKELRPLQQQPQNQQQQASSVAALASSLSSLQLTKRKHETVALVCALHASANWAVKDLRAFFAESTSVLEDEDKGGWVVEFAGPKEAKAAYVRSVDHESFTARPYVPPAAEEPAAKKDSRRGQDQQQQPQQPTTPVRNYVPSPGRPATSDKVARRLIAGSLGVRLPRREEDRGGAN